MGSHSVTCHPAQVTFLQLPQPKLVLDLATPEGRKADLIWLVRPLHTEIVYTRPKTVIHPSTNRTRRELTSFMRQTLTANHYATPPTVGAKVFPATPQNGVWGEHWEHWACCSKGTMPPDLMHGVFRVSEQERPSLNLQPVAKCYLSRFLISDSFIHSYSFNNSCQTTGVKQNKTTTLWSHAVEVRFRHNVTTFISHYS